VSAAAIWKARVKEGTLSWFINCLRDVLQMNGVMFQQLFLYGIKKAIPTVFEFTRRQMLLWDLQTWSSMVRTGDLNWHCSSTAIFFYMAVRQFFNLFQLSIVNLFYCGAPDNWRMQKVKGEMKKINWNYCKNVSF